MALKAVKQGRQVGPAQVQQIIDALDGTSSQPVQLTGWDEGMGKMVLHPRADEDYRFYTNWEAVESPHRFDHSSYRLEVRNTEIQEPEIDMTKTPRNAYKFWVVDKDDYVTEHFQVAETEQEARDALVESLVGKGFTMKGVEIKLVRIEALKPKVAKDG